MSVLDGELATILQDALVSAEIPQACVVTTQTVTGPPYDPVITNVDNGALGWVDDYTTLERVNSSVQLNDRKVYVLCSALFTPVPGNTVTIGGKTFTVITVQRDPAATAWVLQCRA